MLEAERRWRKIEKQSHSKVNLLRKSTSKRFGFNEPSSGL